MYQLLAWPVIVFYETVEYATFDIKNPNLLFINSVAAHSLRHKCGMSSLHYARNTERIRQMGETEDDEEEGDIHPLITATISTLLRQAGKTLMSLLVATVYASLVISLIVWTATFLYGTFYFMYAPTSDTHEFPLNFGKKPSLSYNSAHGSLHFRTYRLGEKTNRLISACGIYIILNNLG